MAALGMPAEPSRPLGVPDWLQRLPTATLTALAAALLLTGIYFATDLMRTLGDARARLTLVAETIAAQLDGLPGSAAAPRLATLAHHYDGMLTAVLRDRNGSVLAAVDPSPDASSAYRTDFPDGEMVGARAAAGPLGEVLLRLPPETTIMPVLWRAALALALAMAFALLIARRMGGARGGADADVRRGIEALVAAIPFGVACWDAEGRMTVRNTHYARHLDSLGTEGNAPDYRSATQRLAESGHLHVLDDGDERRLLELRRDDGACLMIDERPLADGGFVTLVTDVTQQRRADRLLVAVQQEQRLLARRYHEEKLKAEAASRSKTNFLAHLSHDIRTPLNHIIGFADLMRHQTYGPLGDARYRSYVDMIKASGERLLSSFGTILDFVELESGQKPLRLETFGVDDLVVGISRRFFGRANHARVSLLVGEPSGAVIMADRFLLERMLGNLVENAIRFTPAGGKVVIAAHAAEDGVVLEIADTGVGMTGDKLETLSQPFVFGDAAFTREHGGAGLGVAIARTIAELSGGRLVVDSSPGLGTTVAVSLPRAMRDEAGRAAA